MSNAERQKRKYDRKREAARAKSASEEQTRPYLDRPFFDHANSDPNWMDVEIPLLLAGLQPPLFKDDAGPVFPPELEGLELPTHLTDSIGRAELMVEGLLEAATTLAGVINRYKREALERHGDQERARKLIARLDKNVRWALPQWQLKGD